MDKFSSSCAVLLIVLTLIGLSKQAIFESGNGSPLIKYSSAMLRSLNTVNTFSCNQLFVNIPHAIKRRKRGRRGGVRARTRRRKNRPVLPVIVTGNTQSLNNKLDELQTCARFLNEYRETSLICISETWFKVPPGTSSASLDIDYNFTLVRSDRTCAVDKDGGGGVCLYVSERWCHPNNIHVREQICTPDIELLSTTIRPYYLPREFPKITVLVTYIPGEGNFNVAKDVIWNEVNSVLNKSPDGVIIITGDFNHCTLDDTLPLFKQVVTCPTRKDKTLDLCYINVPDAYKCKQLPPLGKSDHNMVHLSPTYKPKIKSMKPLKKIINIWDESAKEKLRGCFDCTDWSLFYTSCSTLNEWNDVVCSYIHFCEDLYSVPKEICIYPNNKPWVTKALKHTLIEKRQAFSSKNKNKLKVVQSKLDANIEINKEQHRKKIQQEFKSNNTKTVWNGLKTIVGYTPKQTCLDITNGADYANNLNTFFSRFDTTDFSNERGQLSEHFSQLSQLDQPSICEKDVANVFSSLKQNKACGPDLVKPKTLKLCSQQLAPVFTHMFNISLLTHWIPPIWKTSEIIPIPKKGKVKEMNDLRPVALTSVLMKCLEKLVKTLLLPFVAPYQDPLQFAYREHRGVDDAILLFVDNIYKHLDPPKKRYVRVLFVDFSSAFNTIQPHILVNKLLNIGVNKYLIAWILEFLTHRPQYVKLQIDGNTFTSSLAHTYTGAPQGCVLSPALFTIYTSDCRSHSPIAPIIKFADDTTIQGLISSEQDLMQYYNTIDNFVQWCKVHHLHLNVKKTKELVIDFREAANPHVPVTIGDEEVEEVCTYKYLGVTIDSKLDWIAHTSHVYSKVNQRMFFIRKLKYFKIDKSLIHLFYRAALESIVCFCITAWAGNARSADTRKIDRVIKKVSKITAVEEYRLFELYTNSCLRKLSVIAKDPTHPLFHQLKYSGRKSRSGKSDPPLHLGGRTSRYLNSFLPFAIRSST